MMRSCLAELETKSSEQINSQVCSREFRIFTGAVRMGMELIFSKFRNYDN